MKTVNSNEATQIIEALRNAGRTYRQVAAKLNKAGFTTIKGRQITPQYLMLYLGKQRAKAAVANTKATRFETGSGSQVDFRNEIKTLLGSSFSDSTKVKLISALI